jgi:hypothetical protein
MKWAAGPVFSAVLIQRREKVMVDWAAVPFYIEEVPCSDLGSESSIPN